MNKFYDLRLQMTNSCTQSCRHCFADSDKPKPSELSLNEMTLLIENDLIPRGLKMVTMTGGEPLLRFQDCLEITKLCIQNNLIANINTGGNVNKFKDKIKKLINEGINTIMLPLETTIPVVQNSFTGTKDAYKKTIERFKFIKENGGVTCMRVTIFNWNVVEIPKLFELANELEVDFFRIRPELPAGRAFQHNEYPSIKQINEVTSYLIEQRNKQRKTQIQFLNPHFQFLISNDLNDYNACQCGITKAFVTSEGDVKPCGFYSQSIGNIRTRSFENIWDDSNNDILKPIRESQSREYEQCKNCSYWNTCRGGCPVVIFNDHENFNGKNRYCPIQNINKQA